MPTKPTYKWSREQVIAAVRAEIYQAKTRLLILNNLSEDSLMIVEYDRMCGVMLKMLEEEVGDG